MKRKFVMVLTAAALLAVGTGGVVAAAAETEPLEEQSETMEGSEGEYQVTDLLGRKVTIPVETSSYACIGPGSLRLYCYVADKGELAGVENIEVENDPSGRPYAMALGDLKDAVIIGPGGPGNALDAELLFNAAPDVIFSMYNSETAAVDELQEKTGIPVVALSYGEYEVFDPAIYESMMLIGQITGNEERAEAVVDYMKEIREDLNARTEQMEEKPLVYMGCQSNRGSHGIESTAGNYVLFEALNIRNAAAEAGIPEYAMIDKEQILELDPDIMIIDAGGYQILSDDYKANPDFYETLTAFKEGKVYMQMPYNWYYTNLEIAIADGYYIGSVVYPDAFSDIDIEEKFNEISDFFLGMEVYETIADSYYGGYQAVKLGE